MIYLTIKGGMGAQMCHAAFALMLEEKTGKEIKFLIESYTNYSYGFKYELEQNFPYFAGKIVEMSQVPTSAVLVREPEKDIKPNRVIAQIIELSKKHQVLVLDGYWGMEDYYSEYEITIRERMTPITNDEDLVKAGNVLSETPHIGIHVRRNEYGHHGIAMMDYYRNSLKEIRRIHDNAPAIVFTDEYNVCLHEFKNIPNLTISRGDSKNPFSDFYLLSKCRHFVLSNSSFSFWGAFFGERSDSMVYFPHPFCTFNSGTILGKRANTWHVVEGAVRKA
jgi:hypothetical protein